MNFYDTFTICKSIYDFRNNWFIYQDRCAWSRCENRREYSKNQKPCRYTPRKVLTLEHDLPFDSPPSKYYRNLIPTFPTLFPTSFELCNGHFPCWFVPSLLKVLKPSNSPQKTTPNINVKYCWQCLYSVLSTNTSDKLDSFPTLGTT